MRISCRRSVLVALAATLAVSAAAFGGTTRWKKAYFGATTPGAFARSQSVNTVNGDVSEYVTTRLPDEDGRVVFETRYELKTGQFAGTKGVNRNVMRADFPMKTEGLSRARWVERGSSSGPDGQVIEFDEETNRAIADGATDYGAIVVFKGTETVDGKVCDRYTYSYEAGPLGKVEGEYWLNEKVPFAVVKELTSGTDATGARYRYETKLVESGVRPELAKPGKTPSAAAPPLATLGELFAAGKLSILVDVVPKSSKVRLTVTNSGEAAVELVVPKGKTTLSCGDPVGDLVLVADAERKLKIPAGGEATPFELSQTGTRRPTKGSFSISVYEGQPLFSGSVEMDRVKE